MGQKLPPSVRAVIEELFLKFEIGQLQDMQEVSAEIEAIAIDAYKASAEKERGIILHELGSRTTWERWYYLKAFYKSPSVLGQADGEVTSKLIKEIGKTSIPMLDAQYFTEGYITDLSRHLKGRVVLPWNAFNLAFEKAFRDAKDHGKEVAVKQVLDLIQRYNENGWKLRIPDDRQVRKHLVALMDYMEWLRKRNRPMKHRKIG